MDIRHAKDSDLDDICDLLSTEFLHDPVHQTVFNNRNDFTDVLRSFFRIYVDLARKYGGMLLAGKCTGVLIYFRPEAMNMKEQDVALVDQQLKQVCGSDYRVVATYTHGLEHHHPRTPPHYYIPLLAVQKSSRGGTVVEDLFSALHAITDQDKLPCYAECTRFSTRTLMKRWGYHDRGSPIRIEGIPELFPVWRDPR